MKETLDVSLKVMIIKPNESNNESPLYICNRLCSGSLQISYHFELFLNTGAF